MVEPTHYVAIAAPDAPGKLRRAPCSASSRIWAGNYPVYVFVRDRAAALGGQRGHLENAIDEVIDQFGIQRRAVQRKLYSMARGERMIEEINASVALDGAMRTALNSALEERIAAAELQPDEVKELRAISYIPFMFRLLDALIKSKRRHLSRNFWRLIQLNEDKFMAKKTTEELRSVISKLKTPEARRNYAANARRLGPEDFQPQIVLHDSIDGRARPP